MHKIQKNGLYAFFAFWVFSLIAIDRYFFKCNDSFSLRFLYSTIPNRPEWDLPALTDHQDKLLDDILAQKFTYLAKGAHCFAFESADQKYIIKFHRHPSHMRPYPWLKRPFAYHFDKNRIATKEYNLARYTYFMNNYKASYDDLKKETGIIFLQLNRTENLKKKVMLVDKTGNKYCVPLNQLTFILQHKAQLIFPSLDLYLSLGEDEKIKNTISHVMELIVQCCQKGYKNSDPILHRNFGLLSDRAITIDIGDFVKQEEIFSPDQHISHLEKVTQSLRTWIIQNRPDLLSYFLAELKRMRNLLEESSIEQGLPLYQSANITLFFAFSITLLDLLRN